MRTTLFAEVVRRFPIGDTPLVELPASGVNNRLFVKLEYVNHTGSHYDRVYFPLLRQLEEKGEIVPDRTTLVEVTSGNAGVAFAFAARMLGYRSVVFVPASLPESRKAAIKDQNAKLLENHGYIKESVRAMRKFLVEHRTEMTAGIPMYVSPNHSREPVSWQSMSDVGKEALMQVGGAFDCFIGAAGNGTTLLGIGKALKEANALVRVIAFDPAEARVAYRMKHGIDAAPAPGEHKMYGAGVDGVEFPFLKEALAGLVDEVDQVSEAEWKQTQAVLHDLGFDVGHTSAAAYHLALRYCEDKMNQRVLIIFYDKNDRY